MFHSLLIPGGCSFTVDSGRVFHVFLLLCARVCKKCNSYKNSTHTKYYYLQMLVKMKLDLAPDQSLEFSFINNYT